MGEEIEKKYSPRLIMLVGVGMVSAVVLLIFGAVYTNLVEAKQDDKFTYVIPEWVKANAGWWSEGYISDQEFSYSLQWLFDHGYVEINECVGRCN